jgi:hypothetical protein
VLISRISRINLNQSYPKLSIEEFGAQLLATQDLDPVYTMLYGAQLDLEHLKRWLFAYSFSYSAGVVSWLSERQDNEFWDAAMIFAKNETESPVGSRWPRGRERRYFRGSKCERAIQQMKDRFQTPEAAFTYFVSEPPLTCPGVMKKVQELPLYGPWIGFKVADLIDRVMGIPVEFTMPDVTFFESPRKAAKQWAEVYAPGAKTGVQEACDYIAQKLGNHLAPPRFDRTINLAEIETVLCKWGSHMNWNYPIGIDTVELREALHPWAGVSPTAARLSEFVPK